MSLQKVDENDPNSRGIPGGPLVPGGQPVEFTETIANPGPHNDVIFPDLVVGAIGGSPELPASQQKVEIEDNKGVWHTLKVEAGWENNGVGLYQFGPTGANWLYLDAGKQVQFQVRLSLTADAPKTGIAFVNADADGFTLDEGDKPIGAVTPMTTGFLTIAASAASSPASSPAPSNTIPGVIPSSVTKQVAAQAAAVTAPAPAVVAAAKAADKAGTQGSANVAATPAPSHSAGPSLAFTGGGSDSLPIALTGAAVIAAGVATLVVVRRRKGSHAA
ncbi:hypothetical protein [Kitasatospora kifunensis]|uniref:Gram-positive cocci surface proteins LPxTG domain-containing protein n=1 Tax=Kitasatospora kifunensis TaxID=58351 RepID=A0A7W7R4W7_KITKI|nr:hypothetical protein [Kitasatospora kifunensis]MBB4925238.1 hypothetical protein [Kitasatospora kifunensis]